MADEEVTMASEEGAKGKKGSPMMMYIIIAVVMVAAGYFGGQMFGGASPELAHNESPSEEAKSSGGHGEPSEAAISESEIFLIEDVIVNPSGTGGTRFLSVTIGFDLGSQASSERLKEREPIIKDALITILGSKTIDQLTDTKEKEITRFQIKKRVEHLLKVEDIAAVYFTDYILQ